MRNEDLRLVKSFSLANPQVIDTDFTTQVNFITGLPTSIIPFPIGTKYKWFLPVPGKSVSSMALSFVVGKGPVPPPSLKNIAVLGKSPGKGSPLCWLQTKQDLLHML